MNTVENPQLENALRKCIVIDFATTALDPVQAEICQTAVAIHHEGNWIGECRTYNTMQPIPVEAAKINKVTPEMQSGQKYFHEDHEWLVGLLDPIANGEMQLIAHNATYDHSVLLENVGRHPNDFLQSFVSLGCAKSTPWICTMRMAKKLVQGEPSGFGLYHLHKHLKLEGDVTGLALDNAIATGRLLEKLLIDGIASNTIDESMIESSMHDATWGNLRVHRQYTTWPIGTKHKGDKLTEIPMEYYQWAIHNVDALQEGHADYDIDLTEATYLEVKRRLDLEKQQQAQENENANTDADTESI